MCDILHKLYLWEDEQSHLEKYITSARCAAERLSKGRTKCAISLRWVSEGSPLPRYSYDSPPAPLRLHNVKSILCRPGDAGSAEPKECEETLLVPWREAPSPLWFPECVILDVYDQRTKSDRTFVNHIERLGKAGYPFTRVVVCSQDAVSPVSLGGAHWVPKRPAQQSFVDSLTTKIAEVLDETSYGTHEGDQPEWNEVQGAFAGSVLNVNPKNFALDVAEDLRVLRENEFGWAWNARGRKQGWRWVLAQKAPEQPSSDGCIWFCEKMQDLSQYVTSGKQMVLPIEMLARRSDEGIFELMPPEQVARNFLARLAADKNNRVRRPGIAKRRAGQASATRPAGRRPGPYRVLRWDQVSAMIALAMLVGEGKVGHGANKIIACMSRVFGWPIHEADLSGSWALPNFDNIWVDGKLTLTLNRFMESWPGICEVDPAAE